MFNLFVLSLIISIIIWLFNLEKGNGMGNVWLRPNEDGKIIFSYRSLIKLLIEPLKNIFYWKVKNWDINFYVIFILVFICIFILQKLEP